MLMENFGLERHGKLFAHYAEESKAFLRGRAFHIQVDESNLFTLEFAPEKQVVQSPRRVRVMTDLKTAVSGV
ncbi:hypothetical protein G5714_014685 [Onychostoma macrolepis]|uniref:Uncharacterized protein n=1 Tax=Onychostoma macrolepis TaxID=369639 RepID=A0A7J6CE58_9TELE|nr:hypothetical protein G5714_014685 [Onychostoma macrolepis]